MSENILHPMRSPMRAGMNRTLRLEADELQPLRSSLLSADKLRAGKPWMDSTILGDTLAVLPLLPDEFADLIIIDPPYNLSKNFGGTKFNAMPTAEYEAYVRSWLPQVCRKLKPDGSLYLCGDWKCTSVLQRALSDELTVLNRITWQREKGRGAKSNWKNGMEDIWYAVRDEHNYYFNVEAVKLRRRVLAPYRVGGAPKDWTEEAEGNFRLTCPSNFWDDITVPFWSMPENTDHPTQKPEKLFAKLVLASSGPGDIVFDPFLGSGTTSVVAKKLGRHYVGIEANEEYCLYAAKRLLQAAADPTIQGYQDGVFWERNSLQEQKRATRKPTRLSAADACGDLFSMMGA